jgi:hypothetical protein
VATGGVPAAVPLTRPAAADATVMAAITSFRNIDSLLAVRPTV